MTLELIVEVDEDDLQHFVSLGYCLCFTRNVKTDGEEQSGNVIFLTIQTDQLHSAMKVEFDEGYQVFETNKFEAGGTVSSTTDFVDILGGLMVMFDESGHAEVAGGPANGKPFKVKNGWKDWARPGVRNHNANTNTYATIYISDGVPMNTTSSLLPVKKFGVFWRRHARIDSIIDITTSDLYIVDLGDGKRAIKFKDGGWKLI